MHGIKVLLLIYKCDFKKTTCIKYTFKKEKQPTPVPWGWFNGRLPPASEERRVHFKLSVDVQFPFCL